MDDYNTLLEHVTKAEREVAHLENQLEKLKNDSVEENAGEILKLKNENERLKYRINILRQSISKVEMHDEANMLNIQRLLTSLFEEAIAVAFPEFNDFPINLQAIANALQPKFGDYQCTSAMALAKKMRAVEHPQVTPMSLAQRIVECLPNDDLIENVNILEPGYINIRLNPRFIANEVSKLLQYGVRPPHIKKKSKVIIDFSSPNIAKEMHVGHLRSTIIGDSISRLLEFCGYEVKRVNHIGDWGTQFGMLIAHYMETFSLDYEPTISELLAIYRQGKKRFDEEEDFKKKAYAYVVLLQKHDQQVYALWQKICDVSRKEFNKIYQRLDIRIEEKGESFYQPLMAKVMEEMWAKNLVAVDEGRTVMFCKNNKVPLTLVKSDGGYTYDTSDLATIKYRIQREKAEWIIYVVDQGQGLHFNLIFAAAEQAGWLDPSKVRVDHVGFGVVLGEDKKKFKTRSGETVRLVDLLDEGMMRAQAKLREKEREQVLTPQELKAAQEAVAYGCIKYADLSHNRNHEYVFSFDRMLSDKGNTAVYLLYVVTRIRSIARNAKVSQEVLRKYHADNPITLSSPKEINLAKALLKFPEVILEILDGLSLHVLCEYLYNLSTYFTDFYDNCYCIVKDKTTGEIVSVNYSRLLLCEATALVMEKGLHILGIKTVAKM